MDPYITHLTTVIRNTDMNNTYKMVWIRSIVETCVLNPFIEIIPFDELAPKIFGYYWNQTIFFDLEQGPNLRKRPKIHQIVLEQVNRYRKTYGLQPIFFSKVGDKVEIPVSKISSILKTDVCHRFQKSDEIYDLDRDNRTIRPHQPDLIRKYSDVLFDLINYRWTQELERFNSSPRISQKIKGTDQENIRRKSLARFHQYLDVENPQHICFHTGKPINRGNLSIDHVIPWSYLFSDDLWNLVYVDKSYNSSKGNRVPSENTIKRLEERNKRLLSLIHSGPKKNKQKEELSLAIDKDYVRKSWVGCKG
ncbi:MAG: HNH endonuclease [Rhodospirillaceae bacterium]|nr:HNH endonuclease [Rhodospirillaceae bacterium]